MQRDKNLFSSKLSLKFKLKKIISHMKRKKLKIYYPPLYELKSLFIKINNEQKKKKENNLTGSGGCHG